MANKVSRIASRHVWICLVTVAIGLMAGAPTGADPVNRVKSQTTERINSQGDLGATDSGDEPADSTTGRPAKAPRTKAFDPAEYTWQQFTDEQLAAFVEADKAYAQRVAKKLNVELRLYETKHFLFYTNAKKGREIALIRRIMETMYRRVCELLQILRQLNVFRGKCLIFLFDNSARYQSYQSTFHHKVTEGSAGTCNHDSEGRVRVAFHWLDEFNNLRHLMVHETVHGFLARYRSKNRIPSWLNEGLAEYIASQLVPNSDYKNSRKRDAAQEIKQRLSFEGNLTKAQVPFWFYGPSQALVKILVRRNRNAFLPFVRDIKDGKNWQESLQDNYGWTSQEMADHYARLLKVKKIEL